MFFIRYLGSLIYDTIIIFLLFFAFTGIIILFNHFQAIPPYSHWYQCSLFSLGGLYYYSSVKFGGQTLGMKAWRFKLVSLNHKNLSILQIVTRSVCFIPAIFISFFCLTSSYTLLNRLTKTHFVMS